MTVQHECWFVIMCTGPVTSLATTETYIVRRISGAFVTTLSCAGSTLHTPATVETVILASGPRPGLKVGRISSPTIVPTVTRSCLSWLVNGVLSSILLAFLRCYGATITTPISVTTVSLSKPSSSVSTSSTTVSSLTLLGARSTNGICRNWSRGLRGFGRT